MSILVLFWYRGYINLDPDLGWHLQMGNLIMLHGVPATDPFSFTMSSYPFVDHEWLSDVLLAESYKYLGMFWLSGIFSMLALASLLIQNSLIRKHNSLLPIFLASIVLLGFVGIRVQVITWLLFSILLYMIFTPKIWDKFGKFLPLFFILWVNLHGGFGIGIFLLGLFVLFDFLETKLFQKKNLLILLLSLGATLVNPYGYRIWWEIWQQLSDTHLHSVIAEWMPGVFMLSPAFWLIIVISFIFFVRYFNVYSLFERTLYFILLLNSMATIRNIPFFAIVTIPLIGKGFNLFLEEVRSIPLAQIRWEKAYKGLIILTSFLIIPSTFILLGPQHMSTEDEFYPSAAVGYLKKYQTSGRVFSSYNWGGYLIWKLPEKKVFIDGRMPSWRWDTSNPQDSDYAYSDYEGILAGRLSFQKEAFKYNIDTVLWPKHANYKDSGIKKYLSSLLGTKPQEDILVKQLDKMGMKIIYQDKVAVIYRIENSTD